MEGVHSALRCEECSADIGEVVSTGVEEHLEVAEEEEEEVCVKAELMDEDEPYGEEDEVCVKAELVLQGWECSMGGAGSRLSAAATSKGAAQRKRKRS
jgi:hypothetical protein